MTTSSSLQSQLGIKQESVFGTVVVDDHFYQFTKAEVTLKQFRADGTGLRSSGFVERSDQVRVAMQGGEIKADLEWMTKGMGYWLKYLLGAVATTGPTDSAYVHSGTVASPIGNFFTTALNVPLFPSGTDTPLTCGGCKVSAWELHCDVDGVMMLTLTIDCQSIVTSVGLSSASYPASMAPYDWVDIGMTVGAVAMPVKTWSLKCEPGLNVDRYKQQSSALKQEQTAQTRPVFTLDVEPDYTDLTSGYNRVRATLAANSQAAVVITCEVADTGVLIGAATNPKTVITIPKVRFDDMTGIAKDPTAGEVMPKLTGVARWDGTNSPVTIAYTSAETTP